ncbi:tetratricopeptide repeat protein, partial [Flammeovirga pacifica]|uniref:tetratricopeptide repeat protein n=1 Tax=Flammeovirga pacifica TaxID=915059 RepID=UPI0018FEBCF0
MKLLKGYIILCLILMAFSNTIMSQTKADSLWSLWVNTEEVDSTRLKALLEHSDEIVKTNTDSAFALAEISYQYALEKGNLKYQAKALSKKGLVFYRKGDFESSEKEYNKAISLAREVADSSIIANAYKSIGAIYYSLGKYDIAKDYYKSSYNISSFLKDKNGMADIMNNIGIIQVIQKDYEEAVKSLRQCNKLYIEGGEQRSAPLTNLAVIKFRQGDLIQAMELFMEGAKINERNGDDYALAFSYSNIANIYFDMDELDKYYEFINKSLEIRKRMGDKAGILNCMLNLGLGYSSEDKYEEAQHVLDESLDLAREINDRNSEAHILVHIAFLQVKLNETDSTLSTIEKALEINKSLKNQLGIILCKKAYGNYYKQKGDISNAIKYYNEALEYVQDTDIEQTKDVSQKLYEVYKKQNNTAQALEAFELYVASRDSVNNLESQKKVLHQQYEYENEKRAFADSLHYEAQKQITQTKLAQTKKQQLALLIIVVLLILFTAFAVNRVRLTRRQNRTIERQVLELNELNNNLEEKVIERSKKIAEREEQLSYALDASNDGIWDWRVDSTQLNFSPATFTMLGYLPDEFEHTIHEVQKRIHPEDIKGIDFESYLKLILIEGKLVKELRLQNKQGKYIWIQIKGKIVAFDNDNIPCRVVGTFTDITSIKQKAQDILNAVMTTEDIERNRIAKDIHDGLQQTLTIVSLNFQKVRKSINSLPSEVIETFGIGYDYLQKSIRESRSVAHNLMPKAIIDLGIINAFESLIIE